MAPDQLPAHHQGWDLEAHYVALGLVAWVCTLSPQRVIIGGGVMQHPRLLDRIRKEFASLLNGYIQAAELTDHLGDYIVSPELGNRAGVLGALVLAERASHQSKSRSTNPGAAKPDLKDP
jgi:fructokinase